MSLAACTCCLVFQTVVNSNLLSVSMDDNIALLASGVSFEAEALSTEASRNRDQLLHTLRSLIEQGEEFNKALTVAEEAIRCDSDSPVGYLQAGLALTDFKMLDSAEVMFKMACFKSPDSFNCKLKEQFAWIRFLQRVRTSEEVFGSRRRRLSFEQLILESVFEQPQSVLDLIPDEEKEQAFENEDNKHFEDSQKKLFEEFLKSEKLNERPAKRSQKLEATDIIKPTNIFGLKAVWVRDLKLVTDSSTIRIIFSQFGRVVRIGYSEGSSHAFVHFSDPESAVEAISAMNNQIIEGLSAGQKPVKMRFAPDKDQYHLYHSMSRNEYFQRVRTLGKCPGWRLSRCSKSCQNLEHPAADHDIDCHPSRKQLLIRQTSRSR